MVTHRKKTVCRTSGLDPVLKAIVDPKRRQILNLLAHKDLPVGQIADRFRISRPAVIKHLRVLRSARLISVRRCGRERIQSLNPAPLKEIEAWISRFEILWENSLERLKRQIEGQK